MTGTEMLVIRFLSRMIIAAMIAAWEYVMHPFKGGLGYKMARSPAPCQTMAIRGGTATPYAPPRTLDRRSSALWPAFCLSRQNDVIRVDRAQTTRVRDELNDVVLPDRPSRERPSRQVLLELHYAMVAL